MERYFEELARAFVAGRLQRPEATIADGLTAGLRLHKFKAGLQLPRVQRVLGILKSLVPEDLLDVGSGRGTFVWPLLDAFPELPVTAVDLSHRRAADLGAVRRGGVERLSVIRMDVQRPALAPKSFDVVTMLEVLEHLAQPQCAVASTVALARRFVVLSVPSVADTNPEHLHLFTETQLREMAGTAGAARVSFEQVLNHRIIVLRTAA